MRYPPVSPRFPHMLHGADYNPEQWLDTPEVWDEDVRLMAEAHCNVMTVGIFSWALLEPEEGRYTFGWLDAIMDKLAAKGVYAALATPSSAKPAWMSRKYPEIRRVLPDGRREQHHWRHNNCYSSPVYREKIARMDTQLAERYGKHPALLLWHIGNEYGGPTAGECHCDHCYGRFRAWLRERYGSLDAVNRAWWTGFWGNTFTDWDQIEPVNRALHGLMLDWKRFTTWNMVDFIVHEIRTVKAVTPDVPVTNNTMGISPVCDYWKLTPHLDVVSHNAYPEWGHPRGDVEIAVETAFVHDLVRTHKRRPFLLMECTPSLPNNRDVAPSKRPGVHKLASLQAVAHGSDSVQYFQWRQSRGAFEKFHGAVVTHHGHGNTRVFREVAEVGRMLERLDPVVGTCVEPEVAVLFDWDCRRAVEMASGGPGNANKNYEATVRDHYRAFWSRGIPTDVVNTECDLTSYRLLVAPMLYLLTDPAARRVAEFVRNGGTLVTTYLSGIVNESDLCFRGGAPGPLREVAGLWVEETDNFHPGRKQSVRVGANEIGISGEYAVEHFADVIHLTGASSVATYGHEFYAGSPALTVNRFGKGSAWYMAARCESRFQHDFYGALARSMRLRQVIEGELPHGVTAQMRTDGEREYVFVLNFDGEPHTVNLGERLHGNLETGEETPREVVLPPSSGLALERGCRNR